MIGCGFPDLYAEKLASNLSMMAALRQHVCRGRRIYSEGGGTAYLGRSMIIDGQSIPGVDILPFDAELLPQPEPPMPVSRTLLHDCWLGARGTVVRGYKSCRWRLHASVERPGCPASYGPLSSDNDLFFRHHAVGSMIHLHLGALPRWSPPSRAPIAPRSAARRCTAWPTPREAPRQPARDTATATSPLASDPDPGPWPRPASPGLLRLDLSLHDLDRVADRLAVRLEPQGPAERAQRSRG